MKSKALRIAEWSLLVIGVAALLVYGAARLDARLTQERASAAFDAAMQEAEKQAAASRPAPGVLTVADVTLEPRCPSGLEASPSLQSDSARVQAEIMAVPKPDMSDWDPGRRECHARAIAKVEPDMVLGRLDIPSIKVSVLVLPGIDAMCLNGGVGHIPGTPSPGEPGNIGIAGHRDGFFRPLERVRKGTVLKLTSPRGTFDYHVEWTKIVDPKDVSVLAGTGEDEITLVTCYPFRYIGSAPKRFIVRARCAGAIASASASAADTTTVGQQVVR